jgi:hypothetical protein
MRQHALFDSFNAFDSLELRLSLTTLAVPVVSIPAADDPLPDPEPPPPPDPGNCPPVEYPVLPSSGPPGPGS